ncbi:GH92 family glycosyl hydrolase [Streptococcus cameli]
MRVDLFDKKEFRMVYSLVDSIDTRYGTYNSHAFSNGNCLPLTGHPFGMNYFALQTTDQNGSWWFNPYEPVYQGIRLTHQPSPWLGDFSSLLLTPVTGKISRSSLFHRQSSYDNQKAIFRPDLLEVYSHRYQLTSRLVPSLYGAALQLQAQNKEELGLVFFSPGQSSYRLLDKKTLSVTLYHASETQSDKFCMHVQLSFDQDITAMLQLDEDKELSIADTISGQDVHLRLNFAAAALEVRLATSFISPEQASLNLSRLGNFTTIQTETRARWNHLLERIEIPGEDAPKERKLFYHCLYRCLLFPQTFYEVDKEGKNWHFDTQTGQAQLGKFFTNNGYWDTFRSTVPLLSLLYPEYLEDFLEGILQHYKDTGYLPKWLSPDERGIMPGTLVDGVIADAASKGLAIEILPELLEAMITTSQQIDETGRYGRHGSQEYREFGYLSLDHHESVSHSLDYAYSDWAIGQVAHFLGQEKTAQQYWTFSRSYQELFDPSVGVMRAKDREGNFREEFVREAWGRDYAECSSIQATLSVFHDIDGLVDCMGGQEVFTDYLLQLCQENPAFSPNNYGYEIHEMSEMAHQRFGQLAISNQPSFHIPYLFHWSKTPHYAGFLVKQLRQQAFDTDFQAFPGDEDNGSMGAWYIFSCLGFYPVCPGKASYQLGLPQFDRVILHLPNDKDLTIDCQHNHEHFYFVRTAQLDQQAITELHHKDLLTAKQLSFELSLLPPTQA